MSRAIDADEFIKGLTLDTSKGFFGEFMDGSEVAFTSREIAKFVEEMPTLTPQNEPRMINADKLAKRIAGHSNYHGDAILAAIYCAAEGKENDNPIRPIEIPQNEPLTWEELTEETKINPVYSMKYGWIFPDTVKDEPYKQIWFVTSKGFVNTELFYQDTFYRHPPERQEANNNGD